MAIDTEIKKRLAEDWQDAFPQLYLYNRDKLYKIVGPVLIGIELIKMPREDNYRPHFVCYPLWEKDVKSCLNYPFMLREFYNEKKLQYNIPYDNNDKNLFTNVVESIWHQSLISFDGNISLEEIMKSMDLYSKTAPMLSSKESCMYGLFLEAQMKIALCVNQSKATPILEKILKNSWNKENFRAFNIDLDIWLMKLQTEINERDKLIERITQNRLDKKISKLPNSELLA